MMVELRMEEMEDAEQETSADRLAKVKVAIPEAEAIIPHPRAKNKVSVVLCTEAAKERVLREGLKDAASVKLIRRPLMVMVSGIPINAS